MTKSDSTCLLSKHRIDSWLDHRYGGIHETCSQTSSWLGCRFWKPDRRTRRTIEQGQSLLSQRCEKNFGRKGPSGCHFILFDSLLKIPHPTASSAFWFAFGALVFIASCSLGVLVLITRWEDDYRVTLTCCRWSRFRRIGVFEIICLAEVKAAAKSTFG